MDQWSLVAAVLLAVLAGAAIPALVQLRATLRAMETTFARTGKKLDEALATTAAAAGKIDALLSRLGAGSQFETVVRDVSALGRVASQVGDVVRVASAVGAAVGPAVAAGIRALKADPEPLGSTPAPFRNADFKHAYPRSRKQAIS